MSRRMSYAHRGRQGGAGFWQAGRFVAETLAPWSIGVAVLISFTASAGESFRKIDREFRRSTMIEMQRLTLVPPRLSVLSFQDQVERAVAQSHDPTAVERVLPHIRKVDFSREMSRPDEIGPLVFAIDGALLPPRVLEPAVTLTRASQALLARLNRFEGKTLAPGMHPGRSAGATAQGRSPQQLAMLRPDGATPIVSTASRLSSVTPAPVEPEIISAGTARIPAFARVHGDPEGRPVETAHLRVSSGYLDLVTPDAFKRETQCLAEAVYFESRSEPEAGQAAVAQVVMNRVRSGLYPTTVCGVVYQNRHRYKACQFSFACEGRSLAITEPGPWETAKRVARAVLEGQSYNRDVGNSTHYHASYVAPYWSRKLKRTDKIGRHIFYRLRPGQT